jgi:hypothetical protein
MTIQDYALLSMCYLLGLMVGIEFGNSLWTLLIAAIVWSLITVLHRAIVRYLSHLGYDENLNKPG